MQDISSETRVWRLLIVLRYEKGLSVRIMHVQRTYSRATAHSYREAGLLYWLFCYVRQWTIICYQVQIIPTDKRRTESGDWNSKGNVLSSAAGQ